MTINLILAIIGLVCLILAAFGVPAGRVNLFAMGMALWLLSIIIVR